MSVAGAVWLPSASVTRWPLDGTVMRWGTANSVAKLLSSVLTSKVGRASGSAALRPRAAGDGAGAMAMTGLAVGLACGGGETSSVQGRGSRPCVARPGWPVESVSCTLPQSSPLFCATSAWRSISTVDLSASSVAR